MWPFSQPKKIEGQAQAAFDHPKIHRELNGGMGVTSLSIAAGNLSGQFTARLRRVDELVQGAINRCHRSWSGSASEAMTQESSPFRDVVQQSEELSAALAKGVEGQSEHFSRTKNSMPAPHNVPPLDLGFSDLAPTNLGAKLAGQQVHEAAHNEAEQKAREDYAAYRTSSNSTVQSLQPYPPVPAPAADVGVDTQRPNSVDPSTGYSGVGSTATSSSARTPVYDGNGDTSPGNQVRPSQPAQSSAPAESGSAWSSPTPSVSGATQPPGAGTGSAPVGGGIGVGFVPGAGATPGAGIGRGAGGFGSGNRGGSGSGVRSGLGFGSRGPGGSPGVGTSGTQSASGVRGAAGAQDGVAGAGQRGRNAEDEEHERKYVRPTDEHFGFSGEVDPITGHAVAPPVIGDGGSDALQEHENDERP